MDSYGSNGSGRFPSYMTAVIQRFTRQWHLSDDGQPGWQIRELALGLQHGRDVHSCGAWSIWLMQQWLKYLMDIDQTQQTFEDYFTQVSLQGGRKPQSHAGPRLRELFETFMTSQRAVQEPCLTRADFTKQQGTVFKQVKMISDAGIDCILKSPVDGKYDPRWAKMPDTRTSAPPIALTSSEGEEARARRKRKNGKTNKTVASPEKGTWSRAYAGSIEWYSTAHTQHGLRLLGSTFHATSTADVSRNWACAANSLVIENLSRTNYETNDPVCMAFALKGTLHETPSTNPAFIFGDFYHWRMVGLSSQHRVIYIMGPYGSERASGFP